ncbi:MAG: type II toxin-antitoxin system VapC family toxin [Methylococcales bacterium]|nr:type II toxin-antitoxin system VapC family toxin [Methylococcales bacterium]
MYLMDVNIFVYAHREDVADHSLYREWLEFVLNSDDFYGVSELVLSGFLRVVTHPKVFNKPTPIADAVTFIRQVKEKSNAIVVSPKERHWSIFENLVTSTQARGNLIPDAYHAALAIEAGCEWVTTDKGFKRFKRLTVKHPLK